MTRLLVPVTTAMSRLDLLSNRVEISAHDAATDRGDLRELGLLLASRGADAAWAMLDPEDDSVASWVALTMVPLDGESPDRVRRRALHDDPIEVEEGIHETALGPAIRIRQRVALPAPGKDAVDSAIVGESLDWSWVMPDDKMLSVTANTTQLDYVDWVSEQVDRMALGIDLVR
jgi:hypothetical protein